MACKLDVRKAILKDAKQVLDTNIPVQYRNTYSWVDESTIRINNRVDNVKTKVQSKTKSSEQAYSIAQWIRNKVGEIYGTYVSAYVHEKSRFDPILINIIPTDEYIDAEYNNLPENHRNDPNTQVVREFERRMEEEQIDEFGDSTPMYRRIQNEVGDDYFKNIYESARLSNFYDFKNVNIPTIKNKFAPDEENVYHGTNNYSLDEEGNLILNPSLNFSGKTESISLTQVPVVAQDYMLRKKGNIIIKINNDALPEDLSIESVEEIALNRNTPLIIPKGMFEIIEVKRFADTMKNKYSAEVGFLLEEIKQSGKNLIELLDVAYSMRVSTDNFSEVLEYESGMKAESEPDWYVPDEFLEGRAATKLLKELQPFLTREIVVKELTDYIVEKIKNYGHTDIDKKYIYRLSTYGTPSSPHGGSLIEFLLDDINIDYKNPQREEIIEEIISKVKSQQVEALKFYNSKEQIKLRQQQNKAYLLISGNAAQEFDDLPFNRRMTFPKGVLLSNIERNMYETNREGFLEYVYQQLNNVTQERSIDEKAPLTEEQVIYKYGQSIVDAANALMFERKLKLENEALGKVGIEQIISKIQENLGINVQVISEQQARTLTEGTTIPYQGEPAFFYKGEVYLVEGKFDTESKLHELIHPFVRAIAKYNPELFNNLYASAKDQTEIFEHVSKLYPELVEMAEKGNLLPFMEEFMTYLIQKSAVKEINQMPQAEQNMLQKFWNALKYFLRQIFKPKISLASLNENTSVEDLIKLLLYSDTKIDIRGKDGLWNIVFPMFNRTFIPRMEQIKEKINPQIETFFTVTKVHLERIRNSKNLKELKEILGQDEKGNDLVDARNFLNIANKLIDDLDNDKNKLLTFAEAVSSIAAMSEKMIEHVESFVNNDQVGERYKIGVFVNYGYLIKDWKQVLQEFNNDLGYKRDPLKDTIVATLDRFDSMETIMKDFNKKTGLVKVFMKEFESNKPLQSAIKKLEKDLETLKEEHKTNKKVAKRLEDAQKLYNQANPSEENISKWLAGEMGDANSFSLLFESYTSNPNPIVGGFANMFFKEKAKLDAKIQQSNSKFFDKFKKIFDKFKIDRNAIEDTFDKITDVVKVFFVDGEGNPQERDLRVFANQYSGNFQYLMDKYQFDLDKLDRKSPEYLSMKKEFEAFKNSYMFSENTDIVNQSRQFWLQTTEGEIAYEVRKKLLNEIEVIQLRKDTTPEEHEKTQEELKVMWRRYSRLASEKRLDGTPKTEQDEDPENNLIYARIFKEFREKFGNLYERIEIPQAFENAKKLQEETLKEQGLAEESIEFKETMSLWLSENIRIANSPKFYEDRQKILDEIKTITDKFANSEKQAMDISGVWSEIFDVTKGFRDEDGQPIGNDLNLNQQKQVAELEEKIEQIRRTIATKSGLSREESERYYNLFTINKTRQLTVAEIKEWKELRAKKKLISSKITEEESERLTKLIGELRDFQTKIPTHYYVEEFNKWLKQLGKSEMTFSQLRKPIPLGVIESYFADSPDFEAWFTSNHSVKQVWGTDSKTPDLVYERNYIWNRIIPKDEEIEKAIEEGDYVELLTSPNPYLSATPSNDYYFYTLKKEHTTPRIEGVTVNNRGKFLPRPTRKSATPEQIQLMEERGIVFAQDDRYESKIYLELKNNSAFKGYNELNELYKQHHLKSQEGLPKYAKLWYEVPRMRKTAVEKVTVENAKEGWQNVKNWFQTVNPFVKKEIADAFTENQGNWELPEIANQHVMTDLFGNQPTQIPIKFTSFVAQEDMSKDLGGLVLEYATSAELNKMLQEINPVAQVLRETLLENKIQKTNAIAKNFLGLKFNSPKVFEKDKIASNMYKAVDNFIETFIEGKTKKFELGVGFDRFANHLMRIGAFGSLVLSPVAAIRNLASGNIQKTLEGIGTTYSAKDIMRGEIKFDSKFIPALVKDYTEVGARSLETQLFELFDPLMNYTDIVSKRSNRSLKSDIVSGKFLYSLQKGGEIHVQGSTFVIMMEAQKVDFTDSNTGVITKIPYGEAFTLINGIVSLREGVDKEWDISSDNFAQFKLKVQKTNERLQGAYSNENASEAQRYTSGALVSYMRKYFVPMFMNRFGSKRLNVSAGDFREGYYITTLKSMRDTVKNGRANWHNYSQEEKQNLMKTLAEISYSLLFTLLISLLGWDKDDKDKYKKLEDDWIRAYLIYQIMAIKSESETFIPIFGMGADEWLRNITTPTVAWNVLKKYRKMTEDLFLWTIDSDDAYYDKKYGVYDKGDVKFLADLSNITGLKNWLVLDDPAQGVKQYVMMSRRY